MRKWILTEMNGGFRLFPRLADPLLQLEMNGYDHIKGSLLGHLRTHYLRELFVHFLEDERLLRDLHLFLIKVDIYPFQLLPLVL